MTETDSNDLLDTPRAGDSRAEPDQTNKSKSESLLDNKATAAQNQPNISRSETLDESKNETIDFRDQDLIQEKVEIREVSDEVVETLVQGKGEGHAGKESLLEGFLEKLF